MTPRPLPRNPQRADARPRRWLLALPLIVASFGAGWLYGRGPEADSPPHPAASADAAAPGSAPVELRLDAAAVSLLPEGGLELRPLLALDAAPPFAEAGPSPSSGSGTSP